MKTITNITSTIIVLTALCFAHNPLFSQKLSFDKDTVIINPGIDDYSNGYIRIQNETTDTIQIEWTAEDNTLNQDWKLQFCDFEFCYTNEFGSLKDNSSGDLAPGYNDEWYLGVDLNDNDADSAIWTVSFSYSTTFETDTLVWIVTDDPVFVSTEEKIDDHTNFTLYPNPASSQLNIKRNSAQSTKYRILDLTGKELTNGTLSTADQQIDVSHLSEGVYFLEIQKNGNRKLSKFIKK